MAKETVKEEKIEKKVATEKSKKAALREVASASKKGDLITKYQSHKDDTGSIEVQIAVLTKKVSDLTKHLQEHKKDFDSRRGLLMMVGKRRRLLNYLKKTDEEQYNKLIADLGLRR
jgi:small subunit ribosomal protein S15